MNISKEEKKSEREALKQEKENKRIENYLAKQKEYFRTHKLLTGKRLFYSIILCIFFGFLGVHSFYNRQYKKGLLQLLFTTLAIYILWIVWFRHYSYFYFSSNIYQLSICGFLWAGYDLFLMSCKRYYVPLAKNEIKQLNDIKLEIGSKSKTLYLLIPLLCCFCCLEFFVLLIICFLSDDFSDFIVLLIFIFIPFILQYFYTKYGCPIFFCFLYFCSLAIWSMVGSLFAFGIIVPPVYVIYILLSSLQERIDGDGKLFKLPRYWWTRVIVTCIIGFIILASGFWLSFIYDIYVYDSNCIFDSNFSECIARESICTPDCENCVCYY